MSSSANLGQHLEDYVSELVKTGRYGSRSEVLREGLRLVEQREAEDAHRLEALRAAVQLGAADIAAGRFKSFETQASLRDHLGSVANNATASV